MCNIYRKYLLFDAWQFYIKLLKTLIIFLLCFETENAIFIKQEDRSIEGASEE